MDLYFQHGEYGPVEKQDWSAIERLPFRSQGDTTKTVNQIVKQLNANPQMRMGIENVARAMGIPPHYMFTLAQFESGLRVDAFHNVTQASGLFQFEPKPYQYAIAKYGASDTAYKILSQYAPEAAEDFRHAGQYMRIEDKRTPDGKLYSEVVVAKGHEGEVDTLIRKHTNEPAVQTYLAISHIKAHAGPGGVIDNARLGNIFGMSTTGKIWDAVQNPQQRNAPVGSVVSQAALQQNRIDPKMPVWKFYNQVVENFVNVADQVGGRMGLPIVAHNAPAEPFDPAAGMQVAALPPSAPAHPARRGASKPSAQPSTAAPKPPKPSQASTPTAVASAAPHHPGHNQHVTMNNLFGRLDR